MRHRLLALFGLFLVFLPPNSGATAADGPAKNLVANPTLTQPSDDRRTPAGYHLSGDAVWTQAGRREEVADRGAALHSGHDIDDDGLRTGTLSHDVRDFPRGRGQWLRFSIRGLPQDGFRVASDDLYLKVEFYSGQGRNYLDCVTRKIYSLLELDRRDLAVNGNGRRGGAAVWKSYNFDFSLPFAEIDQLRLIVGFRDGAGSRDEDAFLVDEMSLVAIPAPQNHTTDAPAKSQPPAVERELLVSLGGRWSYLPERVDSTAVLAQVMPFASARTFDYRNAHRLFFDDGRLGNPFAENMSAWLRAGYKDRQGAVVAIDRLLPDNVKVRFEPGYLVVEAHNIPNHPTAKFPEALGGNPSFIQEKLYTYYLPLDPRRNPSAVAMDATNSNRALPGGAIGIAINGVVFYNPFDAGGLDASNIMDRCCGHPSPDNRYHYHKYPVCVKSPFVDEGQEHSPVIGWAFDGFPIYGPYESAGVMAKDSQDNPLNAFNVHHDETRGWHYHVTPGKFPYIIGGWWGEVDPRNKQNNERRGPGGPGGATPGRPPGPPGPFGPPPRVRQPFPRPL